MESRDSGEILKPFELTPCRPRRLPQKVYVWGGVCVCCAAIAFSGALFMSDYSAVQGRRELLSRYEKQSQFRVIKRQQTSPSGERGSEMSWLRHMLGDESVRLILLPRRTTPEELANVRSAFPEAHVTLFPID